MAHHGDGLPGLDGKSSRRVFELDARDNRRQPLAIVRVMDTTRPFEYTGSKGLTWRGLMNLTIDLSEQNAAALEAQARSARMPAEDYLARIVALALERQHRRDAENLGKHLDYMASQVAPDTTNEEMEAALQEALMQVRPNRNWHL